MLGGGGTVTAERSQQQVYYSQGNKLAGGGRSKIGRIIDILANLCWAVTAVLSIIAAGLILGRAANRTPAGTLLIIGFGFFLLGSILKFIYDIVTVPTRYNRVLSVPRFLSDVLLIIGSVVLLIGACLYSSNGGTRNGNRLAGCILFIIGFSILFFSFVLRWFATEGQNLDFIRQGAPATDYIRAWCNVLSNGLFILSTALLLIGAALLTEWPRGRHRNLEEVGSILWLIGWPLLLAASLINMLGLSPLYARAKEQTVVQQTMMTNVPAASVATV
jgi:hypothetical protein